MVKLPLSDEQVIQLARQLSPEGKRRVMRDLNAERDSWWEQAALRGERDLRRLAAERGLAWRKMNESERERFVDHLLQEPSARSSS